MPTTNRGAAGESQPGLVRVATFNIKELSTGKLTSTDAEGRGLDEQARGAAEIVQRVEPDVLVLNEIDLDSSHPEDPSLNARRFAEAYLATGLHPVRYRYAFAAPSNTGLLSGFDLNGDGRVATEADRGTREHGEDAFGYGIYSGQYAMAVLSRFPLDSAGARTFQLFRWSKLPGNHMPRGHFPADADSVLRLSSKSHWDLPVVVDGDTVHLWVSHPTPPGFDGPEDRNGRRNFDEIRFWLLYLEDSAALVDDAGRPGGYGSTAPFVIAGDLNARPADPAVVYDDVSAIDQLLGHPRIQDPTPTLRRSAEFLGGVRVDYVLPSWNLDVLGGGAFDPDPDEDPEAARLAEAASDHRLVWADLALE